ncbi:MAG TPA: carbohydrate kinase family protein [Propionicimonas sp.]|jgi:pseudouridine kinase|nr:carbohydrate kinase family protein [Propionicimonas sp.]
MSLSPREQQILSLLRSQPTLDAAGLARTLGTSRGAVAVALSSLTAKGEIVGRGYLLRDEPWAVVVGGAAMDIKARSLAPARLGTSNPGTVTTSPGGVGRNIAEGLARLGSRVHLIAAVGADIAGRDLLTRTGEAGVMLDGMLTSRHPTGSYLALLDADGELLAAVSDLAATDAIEVADLARSRDLIGHAAVVVLDGNLPAAAATWVLATAAAAGARVVVEPVSVTKAGRLAPLLHPGHPVFAITPNLDELAALVGRPVADTDADIRAAADSLHSRGVGHVWVSRGPAGSLLCAADGSGTPFAAVPAEVMDVTGAGDAMTAGFVHALLRGASPAEAVRQGHLAAALTVASAHAVPPGLGVAFAAALASAGAPPAVPSRPTTGATP